jgi:hypothetical protein
MTGFYKRTKSGQEDRSANSSMQKSAQANPAAEEDESMGLNLIRACSETLTQGVAKCMIDNQTTHLTAYSKLLTPIPNYIPPHTFKHLIQLLDGGKKAGSTVKFSKFYLIVDQACFPQLQVAPLLLAF